MIKEKAIILIITFSIAFVLFIISILQFKEKGFLFNNAYIYASEEERKKLNKKPYYRQSSIVFMLLSLTFIVIGLQTVTKNSILLFMEICLIVASIVYAVVSTVKIEKENKDK